MKLPSKKFLLTLGLGIAMEAMSVNDNKPIDMSDDMLPGENAYPIMQFVDSTSNVPVAVISAGKKHGIVDSAIFEAYRRSNGVWIKTGTLKATQVNEDNTIAQVLEEKTSLSSVFFPKFPGVMAGDLLREKKFNLARAQVMTPTVNLYFHDLFVDPGANPSSFELSDAGKEKLRQAALAFANVKLTNFAVEGHTDQAGSSNANQVESYQRALTVRQFLATELGFATDRITALGFGESEPLIKEFTPGYHEKNRRIVLKAISRQEEDSLETTQE